MTKLFLIASFNAFIVFCMVLLVVTLMLGQADHIQQLIAGAFVALSVIEYIGLSIRGFNQRLDKLEERETNS